MIILSLLHNLKEAFLKDFLFAKALGSNLNRNVNLEEMFEKFDAFEWIL
jgi:hypothetical protein